MRERGLCVSSNLCENCFRVYWVSVAASLDINHISVEISSLVRYSPLSYAFSVLGSFSFVDPVFLLYLPPPVLIHSRWYLYYFAMRPVFSVLPQSTISAKTLFTDLTFVYLLCYAWLLPAVVTL